MLDYIVRRLPPNLSIRLASRFLAMGILPPERRYQCSSLRCAPSIQMQLKRGDIISDRLAWCGIYEWPLTEAIARAARSGGLLVDVGANLGYFSLLWTALGSNNRSIAFEASPRNVPLLRANIERNQLFDRVQLFTDAVGRENGTIEFDLGPEEQTGWGGISLAASDNTVQIPMSRLDDHLSPDTEISLLKIDIEGADTWAIMGAEKLLLAKKIKWIFFERNPQRMGALGISDGEAERFLESVGYEVFPFDGNSKNELVAKPLNQ